MALKSGDQWVEGVTEVKVEVVHHFQKIFSESSLEGPILDGVHFVKVTNTDNICSLFSVEENKEIV